MPDTPASQWRVETGQTQRGYQCESFAWNSHLMPWIFPDRKTAEDLAALLLRSPQVEGVRIVEVKPPLPLPAFTVNPDYEPP